METFGCFFPAWFLMFGCTFCIWQQSDWTGDLQVCVLWCQFLHMKRFTKEKLVLVDDSVAFLQACAAELNLGGVQNSEEMFTVVPGSRFKTKWILGFPDDSAKWNTLLHHEASQKGCLVVFKGKSIQQTYFRLAKQYMSSSIEHQGSTLFGDLGLCEPWALGRWAISTTQILYQESTFVPSCFIGFFFVGFVSCFENLPGNIPNLYIPFCLHHNTIKTPRCWEGAWLKLKV